MLSEQTPEKNDMLSVKVSDISIMLNSAGTDGINAEKLPENTHDFVKEALEAALMTDARAAVRGTYITNAVTVFVNVTRCVNSDYYRFAADTAFGNLSVLDAGCGSVFHFNKRMNMSPEFTVVFLRILLSG